MSEDPHHPLPQAAGSSAHTQPFGQGAEDFADATSRGLKAIQDCTVPDAELGLAGLALEVLDIFLATVATAAD